MQAAISAERESKIALEEFRTGVDAWVPALDIDAQRASLDTLEATFTAAVIEINEYKEIISKVKLAAGAEKQAASRKVRVMRDAYVHLFSENDVQNAACVAKV